MNRQSRFSKFPSETGANGWAKVRPFMAAGGPLGPDDGGVTDPGKPGLLRSIKGIFNPNIRTQNRFDRAVHGALNGQGSSQFTSSSDFVVPTTGAQVGKGQLVRVTPQSRSQVVNPGTPGSPMIPGTPEYTERVLTGQKENYTPGFLETGDKNYGNTVVNIPPNSKMPYNYNNLPANMNPGLKSALQQAVAGKQELADYKGKPYRAGYKTTEDIYQDVVHPGTPDTPAVAGTPATTTPYNTVHVSTGGYNEKGSNWKEKNDTDLSWIKRGRFSKPGRKMGKYTVKTSSR